jgi:peptide/nickel transport system permease protein
MSVYAASVLGRPRVLTRVARLPLAPAIAAAVLVALVVVAVFAPLIAPQDPNAVSILEPYGPFSSAHLLGSDASGRDLLSRLIVGSRTALLGPLLVVAIATPIGVAVALLAAWCGGWVDAIASRLLDVLLAFPGLLLAIAAAAVFGASLPVAAIALSVSYIPYTARVVRSEAVRQRSAPYVEALWGQGLTTRAICLRHLLPNLLPLIVAQLTMAFAYATIDVAAISFLGLGVQPPTADWGTMVAGGQAGIQEGHPQEALMAGLCLVVLILAVSIVGDFLSDRAERER